LYVTGEQFKAVLVRMSQLAHLGATEMRVRSLDAIAQLLNLEVGLLFFYMLSSTSWLYQKNPTSYSDNNQRTQGKLSHLE
jgi:hypothetical protein